LILINLLFLSYLLEQQNTATSLAFIRKANQTTIQFYHKQLEKTMSINNIKWYLKSLVVFVLSLIFFSFPHCESKRENQTAANRQQYQDILGCWKGWPIGRFADRNEQLRLISLKPDGNPAITLIYELGQRSRVWECDIDVTCQDSVVSWGSPARHCSNKLSGRLIT
jgi:hypothetical protein